MVVFTCLHCGDMLQKPKVAKHYEFRCRKPVFVTCTDCLTDFQGNEYVTHTKCISEAERYGGKDYVPKASANKGERKQQEWIGIVNNLLNGTVNLSNAERNFLSSLSRFENIPRKKPKFLNFVKSALSNRVNMSVVESIWSKMEIAHKQSQHTITKPQEPDNDKTNKIDTRMSSNNLVSNNHQDNIIDNQNNENICKEYDSARHQKSNDKECMTNSIMDETQTVTKKKSKKRQMAESIETQEEQPATKTKKTSVLVETNICKNKMRKVSFYWRLAILEIVQNKGEISLKKLQKKVVSLYLLHSVKVLDRDKAIAKFHRKLKKIPEITVSENIVKLVKPCNLYVQE
ncbi:cell growth-regulating nucleolar protein [Harpegnathos saltator]|nr:cell growth-regulating nucleolar protein [Harpegnathos saltator]